MLEDKIKFVLYGDIIIKILKVLFLLLIPMIEIVWMLQETSFIVCWMKMNLGNQFSLVFANKQDLPNAMSAAEMTG